ncbi:tyrosine-type recombinase/integrase [Serratia oryzae]|uniref:tyrosine-type recombinase/integrase n=1 Tax=Serratia oryzae TaxID=2034155 RepID=UPI0012E30D61|nr:site-specific integrase [Serratia oryzae]
MPDVTFEQLMEQYFFNHSIRPATEWSYQKVVRTFKRYTQELPADVSNELVLEWRRFVLKELKLEACTWNNKVTHMRALFNFGMKKGLLPHKENPFNKAVVRVGKKKKKTLSKAQVKTVYRLMEQHQELERRFPQSYSISSRANACYPAWFWLAVLDTLSSTGMRQNQLLHVRLRDVNLEERWIDVISEGSKNHREFRVPITSALHPRLAEILERSLAAGAELNEQLFNVNRFDLKRIAQSAPGEHDSKMGIYPIRAFFRRVSRECRFVISPHRFRHTVATNLMKFPDRNIQAVKRLLGHSSLRSTLEYIDEDIDSLRELLEQELMR